MPPQLTGLLIAVAIAVLVVLPIASLMIRRRGPELEKARTAPFTYGVAPDPSPAHTSFRRFPVADQPATLSIYDPSARTAAAARVPGRLLLELPLGPQWPMVTVVGRSLMQGAGLLIARQQKIAGTTLHTGDPSFDRAYWTGFLDAATDDALRVVNPAVRAALLSRPVQRMYAVHKLGISVRFDPRSDVDAQIGAVVRLAELVVHSAQIPTHQGPPATFGPGAPWAAE